MTNFIQRLVRVKGRVSEAIPPHFGWAHLELPRVSAPRVSAWTTVTKRRNLLSTLECFTSSRPGYRVGPPFPCKIVGVKNNDILAVLNLTHSFSRAPKPRKASASMVPSMLLFSCLQPPNKNVSRAMYIIYIYIYRMILVCTRLGVRLFVFRGSFQYPTKTAVSHCRTGAQN